MTNKEKSDLIYKEYSEVGMSTAIELAQILEVSIEKCKPCGTETPNINNECLICGQATNTL